jgi:hypothetical protein
MFSETSVLTRATGYKVPEASVIQLVYVCIVGRSQCTRYKVPKASIIQLVYVCIVGRPQIRHSAHGIKSQRHL